jgi:hypothetical protein
LVLKIDIIGDRSRCGYWCETSLNKWSLWCSDFDGSDDYFENLTAKSKNMVRKARKRGYVYHGFDYNNYLQDIYEINTSKSVRQGKPMTSSYTIYPTPIHSKYQGCDNHTYFWAGGFKDGKMYAYCAVAVVNELAIINTILGHADALTDGIMNGLINYLVQVCRVVYGVKYLNYLTMENSSESLQAFKRHVGFESYTVSFS